tara:strand:- start:213 stop:890 length:678 start_codon:yes stop_codon:yes gene_type:complete
MKNKTLIKEIEKRYGVKFYKKKKNTIGVFVCKDLMKTLELSNDTWGDGGSFKWSDVPYPIVKDERRFVEEIDIKVKSIKRGGDIYSITNSGSSSMYHPMIFNNNNKVKSRYDFNNTLHPYIGLYREVNGELPYRFFRMDNPIIRELFLDTESLVMKSLELHPNGSTKGMDDDMKSYFDFRLKEHKEYLNYFFGGKGGDWLKIYFKKREDGFDEMLHEDYLQREVV